MFKKLLIKLGLLEDPKKLIEKIIAQAEVRPIEYVKVIPAKKKKATTKKKAPVKKKAAKKAK